MEENKWTKLISCFFAPVCLLDDTIEDMDVDLEKDFLHDLKELKVLVNDKDMLDQHKRYRGS